MQVAKRVINFIKEITCTYFVSVNSRRLRSERLRVRVYEPYYVQTLKYSVSVTSHERFVSSIADTIYIIKGDRANTSHMPAF